MGRRKKDLTAQPLTLEVIRAQLMTLPELTVVTPEQTAALMHRPVEQLAQDRIDGTGIPFSKDVGLKSGSVNYLLGNIRDWLRGNRWSSNSEFAAAHNDHIIHKIERAKARRAGNSMAAFAVQSFGEFVELGLAEDEWVFGCIEGRPVEFFSTLGMLPPPETVYEWLTLDDYLVEQTAARHDTLAAQKTGRAETFKTETPEPSRRI